MHFRADRRHGKPAHLVPDRIILRKKQLDRQLERHLADGQATWYLAEATLGNLVTGNLSQRPLSIRTQSTSNSGLPWYWEELLMAISPWARVSLNYAAQL